MRADLENKATASLDPQLLERLRDLPDAAPPPYGFAEFSHRYSRRRLRQRQRPLRLVAAALVVVIGWWVARQGVSPLMEAVSESPDAPLAQLAPPADETQGEAVGPPRGAVLLPTVNAESWLNAHPQRALVRVPAQMAVTELEDQIATMDDQLNAVRLSRHPPQQLALLQRDRAQLVESLAQVRYAQYLVAGMP
ncbi:MAG TPA: hypothetical protein VGV09_02965 [Steroidobacteraceae bacterium]|nr:hypothetical protein [Steroidobacteraceae bacterium]